MFELVLRAPEALVERLSDALVDELEALSVTVEDADAGSNDERALFGEPGLPPPAGGWQRSTVRALFETEPAAEAAAAALLAQPWFGGAGRGSTGAAVQALQAVPDEDWVRLTQAQFEPVPITPTFYVVPSWHEPPAGAEVVLRLDPGLAFGTGTHATTRMCLRWLAGHAATDSRRWSSVLDYGCGSGILAIAAARLGAAAVHAVDIDPAAVRATLDNAARNDVVLHVGLPDAAGAAAGRHALVLANILATPLKLLAPVLARHLAPGGRLVMAGILERQADELRAAYSPYLLVDVLDHDDGWVLMGGEVAPDPAAGMRAPGEPTP
ncbi:MAG: 50S ribosomal protein L11 methyltransferase [Rubrivivax sp.]|nr:50S ribosomal protein L11 methyltransferase [Rubrivivax sp.]